MFPSAKAYIQNIHLQNNYKDLSNLLLSQMKKVQEALTYHIHDQNMIVNDDGSEMLDLFSFLLMSDHSITLAELND